MIRVALLVSHWLLSLRPHDKIQTRVYDKISFQFESFILDSATVRPQEPLGFNNLSAASFAGEPYAIIPASGLSPPQVPVKSRYHSMFKFLLICPTSSLEKNFDPRNTGSMPVVKIFFRLEFEQIS
jgi:hypothetical protein